MNQRKKQGQLHIHCAYVSLMVLLLLTIFGGIFGNTGTKTVYAETVIAYGQVKAGVVDLRIRTSPDTSSNDNIIDVVSGGFTFEIYDKVYTSDTYYWYHIRYTMGNEQKEGYISGMYTEETANVDFSEDEDFESFLNRQGFPESYKQGLRALHEKYPKWVFVADHTGMDWNTVQENENVIGRSLIHNSYASSWKSIADGCYDWNTGEWYTWDSGGWVQASPALVAYAMDPRNFLNETNVFMFENLAFNNQLHTESGVLSVIGGSFMSNSNHDLSYNGNQYSYSAALMEAGRVSGVSPYHLASRIIQEQGSNGAGGSISGTHSIYPGYFNYYNWNAVRGNGNDAVTNGLSYATTSNSKYLLPWNTRMRSIIGGAIKLGEGYINRGQNTIYYEKFDLVSPYWHQYMTNILAARSESVTASRAYSDSIKQNTALVFSIPIYNNMPNSVCEIPSGDGSPNNRLTNLWVEGESLSPSFDINHLEYDMTVEASRSTIQIHADKAVSSAQVTGDGSRSLEFGRNEIKIEVRAENGDVRTYTIYVIRKGVPQLDENDYSFDFHFDKERQFISGIGAGSSVEAVLCQVKTVENVHCKIATADGIEQTGLVSTGNRLEIFKNDTLVAHYTIVIYGDVNGDGEITSMDMLYLKRHLFGNRILTGAYLIAANTNRSNEEVDSIDLLYIKRHVLDVRYIEQ